MSNASKRLPGGARRHRAAYTWEFDGRVCARHDLSNKQVVEARPAGIEAADVPPVQAWVLRCRGVWMQRVISSPPTGERPRMTFRMSSSTGTVWSGRCAKSARRRSGPRLSGASCSIRASVCVACGSIRGSGGQWTPMNSSGLACTTRPQATSSCGKARVGRR